MNPIVAYALILVVLEKSTKILVSSSFNTLVVAVLCLELLVDIIVLWSILSSFYYYLTLDNWNLPLWTLLSFSFPFFYLGLDHLQVVSRLFPSLPWFTLLFAWPPFGFSGSSLTKEWGQLWYQKKDCSRTPSLNNCPSLKQALTSQKVVEEQLLRDGGSVFEQRGKLFSTRCMTIG